MMTTDMRRNPPENVEDLHEMNYTIIIPNIFIVQLGQFGILRQRNSRFENIKNLEFFNIKFLEHERLYSILKIITTSFST